MAGTLLLIKNKYLGEKVSPSFGDFHSADKAQILSYALFLTPSFPRRRESRSVTFGATRHSLIGSHSAEKNELDSRLRGNDGLA
jgi:hypothetical protein